MMVWDKSYGVLGYTEKAYNLHSGVPSTEMIEPE